MKKEKLYDYDVMKAVTILLVVFAHVTRMFTPKGSVDIVMESRTLTTLTDFIYMFHMPAFVAVTGAVYYFVKREKGRYGDQKRFVTNKAARLLIPYLFFAVAVVLPTLVYIGSEENVIKYLIKNVFLFSGPNHLWYSVMIFNVFVLFNFFEDRIHSTHFLKNLLLFVLLYGVSTLAPRFFQLNGTFAYAVYFYLGYAFQKNREGMKQYVETNSTLLMAFLGTAGALYLSGYFSANRFLVMALELSGAVLGTLMLYTISLKMADRKIGKNKIIANLAKDSYGIFLFHPMIIYILFYWIREDLYNPYVTTAVIFLVSLFLSIFLVNVFRRIGMQVLIGEKNSGSMGKSNVAVKNQQ